MDLPLPRSRLSLWLDLIRWDRPAGWLLLLWPTLSALWIAASGFPGWLIWFFVHLAFLSGFGNRLTTMLRWLRSMVGRWRAEREFSSAHTGGDLSLPATVKAIVEPAPFPNIAEAAAAFAAKEDSPPA